MSRLDQLDLSLKLSSNEESMRLDAAQKRLLALRLTLGGQVGDHELGPPVLVLFEGWDASGKGGAIKRLVAGLDPRHVRVQQYAAPSYDEKRHHWLWRFWPALPGWGGMAAGETFVNVAALTGINTAISILYDENHHSQATNVT